MASEGFTPDTSPGPITQLIGFKSMSQKRLIVSALIASLVGALLISQSAHAVPGKYLYYTNDLGQPAYMELSTNATHVIDTSACTGPATIDIHSYAQKVVPNAAGNKIYFSLAVNSSPGYSSINELNLSTNTCRTILNDPTFNLWGFTLSPDENSIYTAPYNQSYIEKINISTGAVDTTFLTLPHRSAKDVSVFGNQLCYTLDAGGALHEVVQCATLTSGVPGVPTTIFTITGSSWQGEQVIYDAANTRYYYNANYVGGLSGASLIAAHTAAGAPIPSAVWSNTGGRQFDTGGITAGLAFDSTTRKIFWTTDVGSIATLNVATLANDGSISGILYLSPRLFADTYITIADVAPNTSTPSPSPSPTSTPKVVPSTFNRVAYPTISQSKDLVTCTTGTYTFSNHGSYEGPAEPTKQIMSLLADGKVLKSTESLALHVSFARNELPAGPTYTCEQTISEKDATETFSTINLSVQRKIEEDLRAAKNVAREQYWTAVKAAMDARHASIDELIRTHESLRESLKITPSLRVSSAAVTMTYITASWHSDRTKLVATREAANAAALSRKLLTLEKAGVSLVL